ncbi:SgcJ/EcaC family oxidoreductase [Streptomyces sp. FH025]|uniref:SgcJ/EcaC family oxidoreductase n=1 Tax=Streptomyces sp. FH025 TaxID=2815937 RepID=UPI001AA00C27|nr:SgcJ/EcaC family oxidoreductase [Streptomyces sp. FH025]MBO1413647.1 SgcJ/EcaC family oxidoreductase [Streptomyces sp. FH025]
MPTTTSPWGDASKILAAAGIEEDATYYREFTTEEQKAVLTVPMRIQDAWEHNDADRFAALFTENGSLLMQDTQMTSREAIRSFMAAGFQGAFRGARVRGFPLAVKFLDADTALVVSQGGIQLEGETTTAPERQVRITWVIVKRDGELKLLSHQSSPIKG